MQMYLALPLLSGQALVAPVEKADSSKAASTSNALLPVPSIHAQDFAVGNETAFNHSYVDPGDFWKLDGNLTSVSNNTLTTPFWSNVTFNHSSNPAPFPAITTQYFAALFAELYTFWENIGAKWPQNVTSSISSLTQERFQRLNETVCRKAAPNCNVDAVMLPESEVNQLQTALKQAGAYETLQAAWPRYAQAINYILNTYGNNGTANYPVDMMSDDPTSEDWTLYEIYGMKTFYLHNYQVAPFDAINIAIDLLEASSRNDSIAFTQTTMVDNAPAVKYAQTVDWSKYKYAAIIVPGMGSDDALTEISGQSKQRVKMAYQMFQQKLVPIIITSGGSVHPGRTHFNEGYEMKRWLVEQFNVPSNQVISDPHARHTPRNLRNAAREAIAFHYPSNMKLLVAADPGQRAYIGSKSLSERGVTTLGYSLGEIGPLVEP